MTFHSVRMLTLKLFWEGAPALASAGGLFSAGAVHGHLGARREEAAPTPVQAAQVIGPNAPVADAPSRTSGPDASLADAPSRTSGPYAPVADAPSRTSEPYAPVADAPSRPHAPLGEAAVRPSSFDSAWRYCQTMEDSEPLGLEADMKHAPTPDGSIPLGFSPGECPTSSEKPSKSWKNLRRGRSARSEISVTSSACSKFDKFYHKTLSRNVYDLLTCFC